MGRQCGNDWSKNIVIPARSKPSRIFSIAARPAGSETPSPIVRLK